MPIRFGADRLVADPRLLGNVRRVALATNDAARSAADVALRTRAALLAAGIPIVRLCSPEHGLDARVADGAAVHDGFDGLTGLPVLSLYGERMTPPPASLHDVDAVLFDIPDVGARFYTYTWTLTYLIDACAEARIPLIVLDRPNPLGGALETVEGPLLDLAHASFIGRHTLPIRHGLTLGELARLWCAERRPDADVRIIPCEGWRRAMLWPDCGLPFVPTSPAISTFEAALCYPGLCFFEATNLSVGRGTAFSFQAVGAPWLEAEGLLRSFAARNISGVDLERVSFTPGTGPHAGTQCEGVHLRVEDADTFRPVATGLALLADVMTLQRDRFEWNVYPTAANPSGEGHFERLAGVGGLRERLVNISDPELHRLTEAPGWKERWNRARIYE